MEILQYIWSSIYRIIVMEDMAMLILSYFILSYYYVIM